MIRLVLTIALCAVTAALAVFLTLNPGSVQVQFLGVNAEAPFALAMGVFLLATFVMVLIWWLVAKIWAAPDAFRKFRSRRRQDQGFDALERALIASAAGQGPLAVRQAARAEALLDRPALSRLLAARAAEADGDLDNAQIHYEAMLEDPKCELVARRGLASIAESRGSLTLALTHADHAFTHAGGARWAFDSLYRAQIGLSRWAEAETTLTEGERRGHIDSVIAGRMRAVLLTAEARRIESDTPERAAKLADKAAQASPGFAPAVELAARLLPELRRHRRASECVETAWKTHPHPALARAYGDIRKSDSKIKRAERMRALAGLNPDHRESQVLLAATAIDQSNRDAARAALTPLLNQSPISARLCVLAARLDQLDGDEEGARRWMARAAHAPAEANWSDIDDAGAAFNFTDADWQRMVDAWGHDEALIHPRHERFEIPAAAAPESALLDAPKARSARAQDGDRTSSEPSFYEAEPAPDDPGVEPETAADQTR